MLSISVLKKLFCASVLSMSAGLAQAQISIGVSVHVGPPALPVYTQPPCPAPNYLWTPGYWAWGAAGYYWVPGVWVMAPHPGLLWTPGYWGWSPGGSYLWHAGYWGPHVGFYGGVNYGFGYGGSGFVGGAWHGGAFSYNTAVVNVNRTVVHNTYINNTVVNQTTINRTSFNGGPNGIASRPTPQEMSYAHENHMQPTNMQMQHAQMASQNRSNFASVNHGAPSGSAMSQNQGHGGMQAYGANRSAAPQASGRPAYSEGHPARGGFGSHGHAQAYHEAPHGGGHGEHR